MRRTRPRKKIQPLTQAPMGIVGLETAVGLTLTYLVDRVLSLHEAIACWTCHPARILRLPGGVLTPGMPGDLTLLDLTREWEVVPEHFRSKSRNTPFGGYRLTGKAVATIVGGQIVYSELTT